MLTALNYTDGLIRQGGMYVFDPKLAGQPLEYGEVCLCSTCCKTKCNEEDTADADT